MSPARAFRFAAADYQTASLAEYVAYAREVEALGYATFLCGDHFERRVFEPGPALTAAALATTTLRVGCTVFDNDFRHPALLAKEAATIDVLTGGRFEIGIGAGWHKDEYERVGIPFDPPATRIGRMKEAVHVIKGLWSDGPFTFSGQYYTITELTGTPKPLQQPHPPIFMGGGGRRFLSIAAQEADIVGISGQATPAGEIDYRSVNEAALAEKVGWVRAAAGAGFDRLELALLINSLAVTDNQQLEAERLAGVHGFTAEGILANPYFLVGSVDQIAEGLLEQRERHGISYITVYEKDMKTFAPVVARLAGR
jgi:probable F420-dependent oxidoreductase